jgi:hypothetical protein
MRLSKLMQSGSAVDLSNSIDERPNLLVSNDASANVPGSPDGNIPNRNNPCT